MTGEVVYVLDHYDLPLMSVAIDGGVVHERALMYAYDGALAGDLVTITVEKLSRDWRDWSDDENTEGKP